MSIRYTAGSIISTMPAEPGWRLRVRTTGEIFPVVMWAVVADWVDHDAEVDEPNTQTRVEAVVFDGDGCLTHQFWIRVHTEHNGDLLAPDHILEQVVLPDE